MVKTTYDLLLGLQEAGFAERHSIYYMQAERALYLGTSKVSTRLSVA